MGLRLIEGRAGAGKTTHCLREIADAMKREPSGPPLLLLVPAQATFDTERALLEQVREVTGRAAYARAEVLSFNRLAWRVAQRTGIDPGAQLSEVGRRMVIRALLQRHESELQLFGRQRDLPGFIQRVGRTMSEFQAHCIDPGSLREILDELQPGGEPSGLFDRKVHDIALLLERYQEFLATGFSDPAEALKLLARQIESGGLPPETRIWIDGFTGFNPQELRLIESLLRRCRQVNITLTLPPGENRAAEGDPWEPAVTARLQVLRCAEETRAAREPDVELTAPSPRFKAPPLALAERCLHDSAYASEIDPGEALCLTAAPSPECEARLAAAEVLRLVREEGYRYRDICILTPDIGSLGDLLVEALSEAGISHFVDRQRLAGHHPVVELLRSALETTLSDWSPEPLFRFLKTDLAPVEREQVDLLENWVLEWGLRGPDRYFRQAGEDVEIAPPWRQRRKATASPDEADRMRQLWERLDEARRAAIPALARFHQKVKPGLREPLPCSHYVAAIDALLRELDVGSALHLWSRQAEEAGEVAAAQEHAQAWRGVVEVLEQADRVLGQESLLLVDFLHVLEAGLQGVRLGLIPAGLDQVQVGQVERLRHVEARAVLLVGAREDVLPRRREPDVIFSDSEREQLQQLGVEPGPTSRLATLREQFSLYLAATRARERLWISYSRAGLTGEAAGASPLLRRLQEILPRLRLREQEGPEHPLDQPVPRALEGEVVLRLARARDGGAMEDEWLQSYEWLVRRPAISALFRQALGALDYRNEAGPLSPFQSRRLWGRPILASPSGVETYTACPFRYFASRGLRLQPRATYRLEPASRGELAHGVLHRLLVEVSREEELDPGRLEELLQGISLEEQAGMLEGLLSSSGRNRFAGGQLHLGLQQAVAALRESLEQSRFRPHSLEQEFAPGGSLPPLRFDIDGEELLVRGRIDRVDHAVTDEGRTYVRVVDYKTGSRPRDLKRIQAGLDLQLPFYLMAVGRRPRPPEGPAPGLAGMYYAPVSRPVQLLPIPDPEAAAQARLKKARLQGWTVNAPGVLSASDTTVVGVRMKQDGAPRADAPLLTEEALDELLARVEEQVIEVGRGLAAGRIPVSPAAFGAAWRACTHCEFRPFCRFEDGVAGMRFRRLSADEGAHARVPAESLD